MKKSLKFCTNGDGRLVEPPSWVLCAECFAVLNAQIQGLAADLVKQGLVEQVKEDVS